MSIVTSLVSNNVLPTTHLGLNNALGLLTFAAVNFEECSEVRQLEKIPVFPSAFGLVRLSQSNHGDWLSQSLHRAVYC